MGEHPPGVVMARGVLPEEPACTMDLSAQAIHTVTIVFLTRTRLYGGGAAVPTGELLSWAFFRIA
jgi:hypothetical protein